MSEPENGLITVASGLSARETIDRLVGETSSRGLQLFARIDHAANAAHVGMQLRPAELVIFGNPQGGTPLMQDKQTAGIDLPLKVLVWEDEDGRAWLTYNHAAWLSRRYGLGAASQEAVDVVPSSRIDPLERPCWSERRRTAHVWRARSGRFGRVADGLDVVAVGIPYERSVVVIVVLGPETRFVQHFGACAQRSIEEGANGGSIGRAEGDV